MFASHRFSFFARSYVLHPAQLHTLREGDIGGSPPTSLILRQFIYQHPPARREREPANLPEEGGRGRGTYRLVLGVALHIFWLQNPAGAGTRA